MGKQADFCGWASKNDLTCADGRIIRSGAFAVQDGAKVPLVYNHQHNSIGDVLGHAILENRDEGVYAYGYFNSTKAGQEAKESVMHGDITSMSIWANDLKQDGPNVLHGIIREVSLVLAGANPGAFIESVMAHGIPMDDYEDEGVFYTGEDLILEHAINEDDEKKEDKPVEENKEEKKEGTKEPEKKEGKTLKEIVDTMNDEQRAALEALVGLAVQEASGGNKEESDKEEEKTMKHNIFSDGQQQEENVLSHAVQEQIFTDARRLGSLKEAVKQNVDGDIIAHAVPTGGMDTPTGQEKYGFQSPDMLYPDYRAQSAIPEFISRNMDWVREVLGAVHHTPFSRVKSMYANITEDEARARGYMKGNKKKSEVFSLLKRTTNPTTIYKLQKMDRDDILDITDFDVVAWIRSEMGVMLDEEIARAILIGDGREPGTEEKVSEECIRPVVKDVDLFNVKKKVDFTGASNDPAKKAQRVINAVIRARKDYKGSGTPTFYTTEDWLTEMLLIEDNLGHKLYKSEAELATAMRVGKITTVEVMEGYKIGEEDLIGVMVNLRDYNIGQDPKAGKTMFDDFDIDYNRYTYLIETRMSGALTKPFSAVTFTAKATDSKTAPIKDSVTVASKSGTAYIGKSAAELQSYIDIQDDKIYGRLHYQKEYSGFDSSDPSKNKGYFLALDLANVNGSHPKTMIINGDNPELKEVDDGFCVYRIRDPKTQQIKVTDNSETNAVVYDLKGLKLD